MKQICVIALFAFFVAFLASCSDKNPANSKQDDSNTSARIVFTSNRESGVYKLYTIALDGSDLRKISDEADSEPAPKWSKDGKSIFFCKNDTLFRISRNGKNKSILARDITIYELCVSANSEKILCCHGSVWSVLDTKTKETNILYVGWADSFIMPDGRTVCTTTKNKIIFRGLDGSLIRTITLPLPENYGWLDYGVDLVVSPNNQKLSYHYDYQIAVLNADGSSHQVLGGYSGKGAPKPLGFSPNGQYLLYAENIGRYDGYNDPPADQEYLYVMKTDKSENKRLTSAMAEYDDLQITRDGTTLFFVQSYDRNSPANIYRMNIDGSGFKSVTNNPSYSRLGGNSSFDIWEP